MIFVLLIYFTWTICLAGSKWNYFLQKADEQERNDDYRSINHYYHKFLSILVLERIESLHPFSGSFNAEKLAENIEAEYDLPAHLTREILSYLRDKKIIFKERGGTLRLSKRYSERTIRQMLSDLDNAGRNSDAIQGFSHIHKNKALNSLWNMINNGAYDDEAILDTPVREILGIKNKTL